MQVQMAHSVPEEKETKRGDSARGWLGQMPPGHGPLSRAPGGITGHWGGAEWGPLLLGREATSMAGGAVSEATRGRVRSGWRENILDDQGCQKAGKGECSERPCQESGRVRGRVSLFLREHRSFHNDLCGWTSGALRGAGIACHPEERH